MAMLKTLAFVVVFIEIFGIIAADGNPSFTFNGFGETPSFDEDIALFGDSRVIHGGSSIQLTDSVSRSEGRVIFRKPIKLFGDKERNSGSFSTSFSFSMSNKIGGVLAFVMAPNGLDLRLSGSKDNSSSVLGFLSRDDHDEIEAVAVEFRSSKKGSRVGIVVGSGKPARIGNLSSFHDFKWSNGEKLRCWIDYEASSKRIEVRSSESGATKPVDAMISYSIDLSKLWKDGKLMVGLSSKNGKNSSQPHFLHSWSFDSRPYPAWMHSQPLDPSEVVKAEEKGIVGRIHRKSHCVWRMGSALIFGAVCGALAAILALCLWPICRGRRPMAVVPEECSVKSMEIVVVDKVEAGEEGNKK